MIENKGDLKLRALGRSDRICLGTPLAFLDPEQPGRERLASEDPGQSPRCLAQLGSFDRRSIVVGLIVSNLEHTPSRGAR